MKLLICFSIIIYSDIYMILLCHAVKGRCRMETKQLDIIFKYCKNYDDIVNFSYDKKDMVTKRIINYYQDYTLDYS